MLTKREEILAVWDYRSGEDSCNSVYLGSMAQCSVAHMLEIPYPLSKDNLAKALAGKKGRNNMHRVHRALLNTIEYMRNHPMQSCPHCGQIMPKGD